MKELGLNTVIKRFCLYPLRFTDPTGYSASMDAFTEAGLDNRSLEEMMAVLFGEIYFDIFLNDIFSFDCQGPTTLIFRDGCYYTLDGKKLTPEEAQNQIIRNTALFQENKGIKYRIATIPFEGIYIGTDPDKNTGSDFSPSLRYRGTISIKHYKNGRFYAEAFAETQPGGRNGYKTGANLRIIHNGEETGFQYLKNSNRWGSHFFDSDWSQIGFARLLLPPDGETALRLTVFAYKNPFWGGNRIHILYQATINF